MDFNVETITPERAKLLLGKNTTNRNLTISNVRFFEEQLKRGEFMLTHQGIAIGDDGQLLDGQHRLHAIVNTGISAQMLVVCGLAHDSFQVLDTGRTRRASDVLSVSGATQACALAGAIRLYLLYLGLPSSVWTGNGIKSFITTTQINTEYTRDTEGWQWAASLSNLKVTKKIVTASPMTAIFYLAAIHHGYSREYLAKFASKLSQGDGLLIGNPILAFRNKVISDNSAYKAQSRLADYLKLLNAYTSGQSLKIFKQQAFPPMPTLLDASESIHEEALA